MSALHDLGHFLVDEHDDLAYSRWPILVRLVSR